MADGTHIEWTDATWNPITGCSVVSPGCTNCYAMRLAGTRLKHIPSRAGLTRDTKAGPVWNGAVRFNPQWLDQPLRWTRPRRIFVCAHGDLFAEGVPDEWIDRVFAIMALCPQHIFQVLTKRPDRMWKYLSDAELNNRLSSTLGTMLDGEWVWKEGRRFRDQIEHLIGVFAGEDTDENGDIVYYDDPMPLPNVWLGVSVEDQPRASHRIPILLSTPAAIRWISAEPLLGPLDLTVIDVDNDSFVDSLNIRTWETEIEKWRDSSPEWEADFLEWYDLPEMPSGPMLPKLDWVVVGGESGPGARPMHPDWVRSIRDQCAAAGVPFFFKQWGEWAPVPWKLERQASESDAAYIERSEAVCSQFAISKSGYLHEMSHKPWSIERALPAPNSHHAVKNIGKKRAGRMLDGRTHDDFPATQTPTRREARTDD